MISFRVSAEVNEDRQVVLTLPAEAPTGPIELLVTIEGPPAPAPQGRRTSLADWAEEAPKPIWEIADEIRRSIPQEEWAKLPPDGASQHDHYLHGAPKRPLS